jgi:hypothetical protein
VPGPRGNAEAAQVQEYLGEEDQEAERMVSGSFEEVLRRSESIQSAKGNMLDNKERKMISERT